mgnify:CR=1 FL=1
MTDRKRRAVRKTWTLAGLILVLTGTSPAGNEGRDEQKPAKTSLRVDGRPGADRSRLPGGHRLRRRLARLRQRHPDRSRPRAGQLRQRATSLPSLRGQKHLACGGLLALLRGQNSIFFFDVSNARRPKFLFSTSGTLSNITDDFLPLKDGGFLVTQMGSHTGGTPGRVAEFDRRSADSWRSGPRIRRTHDFNPHGISARPELNLMVTSDFMMPASSLNVVPGDPLLRGIIRVWDLQNRLDRLARSRFPSALGTMDVKLIPKDPLGRAFTAGMFDGLGISR